MYCILFKYYENKTKPKNKKKHFCAVNYDYNVKKYHDDTQWNLEEKTKQNKQYTKKKRINKEKETKSFNAGVLSVPFILNTKLGR